MELNDLYKGDRVDIMIPESTLDGTEHERWYSAEVVQQVTQDELGEYVGLLVFPTSLWGEEIMKIRSTERLRCYYKEVE